MAITRTFQWYRNGSSGLTGATAIAGATSSVYTTVAADIGNWIHCKETATNSKGSTTAPTNTVGPISAIGQTYTPAAGTIAPLTGTLYGNRPLAPRIVKRSELEILNGEISSMTALHDLMHAATPQTVAVSSGRWSAPGTWSNGVPVAGMTAHIPTGFDVIYDVESSAQLKYIMVHGILRWDVTLDTKLVCDTLHTGPGSYLEIGTAANPVPESTTPGKPRVDIVFIGDAPGSSTRLGLMTMGKVSIRGAVKADKIDLATGPSVGATTLTAAAGQDITGWRNGDVLLVLSRDATGFGPDPQYTGPTYYMERQSNINNYYSGDANGFKQSHDEIRTISAPVSGQSITINSGLTWAHPHRTTTRTLPKAPVTPVPGFAAGQTVTIPARVCNLSRSIRFSSGGAPLSDRQKRGHIMFMDCDQVDVRYAEAKNMARTDTDPTLWMSEPKWDPKYPYVFPHTDVFTDNTLTTNLGNPNNVRGRYAWHLHGGAYGDSARLNRNMCIFEGLTAWAPQGEVPQPGWAITHHNSRLSITNCVVYNVRGAGIVSEIGSEIGQWNNNTVSWCRGDGWAPFWGGRQREQPNHNGHGGVAYENQSRAILQHNNEFTSARVGWLYSVQSQLQTHGYGTPKGNDHQSLRHFNPINGANGGYDYPDRDTYGKAAAQIPDLNFCTGVDFDQFFRVDHRVEVLRGDPTAMICVGWRAYGGNRIQNFDNYTYKYFFRDFAYWGASGGSVAFLGTRTATFGWKNGIVEGFNNLADPGGQGNHGPGWIDINTSAAEGDPFPQGIKDSTNWPNTTPSFTLSVGGVTGYKLDMAPGNSFLCYTGKITDGYSSNRHWPEFMEPGAEPMDPDPGYAVNYVNSMQMEALVERNGCYQNNGQWYMPAYYSTVNWGNFTHFVFKVDHPLVSGPFGAWDPAFLAANTVVPTPPTYPLLPEDINKPFPVIGPPTNTSAPFIYGAPVVGLTVEIDMGKWSGKPNDVDWPSFQWKRNGVAITGQANRIYTITSSDVGQQLTCDVAAYNSGGKSAVVTTAAVVPRASRTPDPVGIFGGTLKDYWLTDGPDTSCEIYGKNIKSPGIAPASFRMMQAWGGELQLTQLDTFGSNATIPEHGWGPDKSRMLDFYPFGRHWCGMGTGTAPIHLWLVVQRDPRNQGGNNGNGGEIIKAAGHSTYVDGVSKDPSQNKLNNDAGGGHVISTAFPKGGVGVIYHGRNSAGSHSGFNNLRSTVANGPHPGDREVNIGYNSAWFGVKALYWVEVETVSDQQHADIQAYLANRYGF